jgi:hypothetical protein
LGSNLKEREREEKRGVSGRKRKKDRGLLAKPSSPSSPSVRNREGGELGAVRRSAPAIAGVPGADGGQGQGEKEEGARAIYSGAHLGWGRLEEVAPRQGAVGGGGCWQRRRWWWWRCNRALLEARGWGGERREGGAGLL